jgi:hypothetical protein
MSDGYEAQKPGAQARRETHRQTRRQARPGSPGPGLRQQPESLRLRSLAASLTVDDLTRSIAWYRDVLRFTPGERWEDNGAAGHSDEGGTVRPDALAR